jgi:hypothetical protein
VFSPLEYVRLSFLSTQTNSQTKPNLRPIFTIFTRITGRNVRGSQGVDPTNFTQHHLTHATSAVPRLLPSRVPLCAIATFIVKTNEGLGSGSGLVIARFARCDAFRIYAELTVIPAGTSNRLVDFPLGLELAMLRGAL